MTVDAQGVLDPFDKRISNTNLFQQICGAPCIVSYYDLYKRKTHRNNN